MKKPKPTWPGLMDEIKAVKKAPAFTDASFTAFFFQENVSPKPHCAALLAFLRMGMKQHRAPLRRRPE